MNTFELNEVTFGGHVVIVPPGLDSYQAMVDLQPEGLNVVVQIDIWLDRESRTVTAMLTGLDPDTGWLPENPLVGILYPNNDTGRGDGRTE